MHFIRTALHASCGATYSKTIQAQELFHFLIMHEWVMIDIELNYFRRLPHSGSKSRVLAPWATRVQIREHSRSRKIEITKNLMKYNLKQSAAADCAGVCNAFICTCAPAGGTDFLGFHAFQIASLPGMRRNKEIVAVRVSFANASSNPCKQRIRGMVFKALPNRRHIEYGGGYALVFLLQPENSIHLSRSIAEQLAKSIAVLTLVQRCSVQLPSREVVVETKVDQNGINSKSWFMSTVAATS